MSSTLSVQDLARLGHELALSFNDPESAHALLKRCGYPIRDIPVFVTPLQFWNEVLANIQAGILVDGPMRLVREAERSFPDNRLFSGFFEPSSLDPLYVRGPDGAVFEVTGVPASTLVRDFGRLLVAETYHSSWPTESRDRVIVDVLPGDDTSLRRRLNSEDTLHGAGIRPHDTLVFHPEATAGRGMPNEGIPFSGSHIIPWVTALKPSGSLLLEAPLPTEIAAADFGRISNHLTSVLSFVYGVLAVLELGVQSAIDEVLECFDHSDGHAQDQRALSSKMQEYWIADLRLNYCHYGSPAIFNFIGSSATLNRLVGFASDLLGLAAPEWRYGTVGGAGSRPEWPSRELVDMLANVAHDPDTAKGIARRAGFPAKHLPDFKSGALEFWTTVVEQALNGRIAVTALVQEACDQFPFNRELARVKAAVVRASAHAVVRPDARRSERVLLTPSLGHGTGESSDRDSTLPAPRVVVDPLGVDVLDRQQKALALVSRQIALVSELKKLELPQDKHELLLSAILGVATGANLSIDGSGHP